MFGSDTGAGVSIAMSATPAVASDASAFSVKVFCTDVKPGNMLVTKSYRLYLIDFDDQFIYDEIDKPIGNRNITFAQLLKEEGKLVFNKWAKKIDKKKY